MACVVYTLHRVAPVPAGTQERGTLDAAAFARQLAWLSRLGVRFVPLRELAAWLGGDGELPRRAAVLTFDDAFACLAGHAVPLLERERIPYTVFVVSGLMGRTSDLYTHKGGRPHRHLGAHDLKRLLASGLVEIGAHGATHRDLTTADASQLTEEVIESKAALERTLNIPVPYFAYPGGKAGEEAVSLVKRAGYSCAFTTQRGSVASRAADPWRLPRATWGRCSTVFRLYRYLVFP